MRNLIQVCQLPEKHIPSIITEMEDIDILIGKNLKRIRERAGLSQLKLALLIGTTPQRISAYETGRDGMGKDYMERVMRALKVEAWEFYITDSTPIVVDDYEREAIRIAREAGALHVAEDIVRYGRFRIEEAKKKSRIETENADRRPQRTRKTVK